MPRLVLGLQWLITAWKINFEANRATKCKTIRVGANALPIMQGTEAFEHECPLYCEHDFGLEEMEGTSCPCWRVGSFFC